jgi:hypothetical protein
MREIEFRNLLDEHLLCVCVFLHIEARSLVLLSS